MAAPTIASSSADCTSDCASGVTVDVPSGTTNGDLLVMFIGGSTAVTPSGWTLAVSYSGSAYVFYRTASSEPGSYLVTFTGGTGSSAAVGKMFRITGHGSSNPFDGTSTTLDVTSSPPISGVTTTTANCLILYAGFSYADSVVTSTPPGTLSEVCDFGYDPGAAASLTIGSKTQSAAGATGTETFTLSATPTFVAGVCVAVSPPSGAPVISTEGSDTTGDGSANTVVSVPSGTTNGDLLIAIISHATPNTTIPTIDTISGWNLIVSEGATGSSSSVRVSAFWRIASSEPANYTFTSSPDNASQGTTGKMLRITGAKTASPMGPTSTTIGTTDASSIAVAGVTTTSDNSLVLYCAGSTSGSLRTFTQTGGFTEEWDYSSDPGQANSVCGASKTVAAQGASGTNTITLDSGAPKTVGIAFAIPPGFLIASLSPGEIVITGTALGGFDITGAGTGEIVVTGTGAGESYPPAFPTITVELAQTAKPLDAISGITWTDISAYARSFSIRSGRQHELQQFDAATATIVLNNRDRRFDPSYTGGSYGSNVKPLKRVRIRATRFGTTYDLFHGYLEGVDLDYVKGPTADTGDAIAIFRCVDAIKLLNLMTFDSSHFREEIKDLTPDIYWPLDDVAGQSARDLSGNSRTGTYEPTVDRGLQVTFPVADPGGAVQVTTNAQVLGTNYVNYERTQAFTAAIVAKFDQDVTQDAVFFGSFETASPYKGWFLSIVDGRFIQFNLVNSDSNKLERKAVYPIQDSRQHLIVVTYDGSSTGGGVSFYIDGVNVEGTTVTTTLSATTVSGSALFRVGGPECNVAVSHAAVIPDDISSAQALVLYEAWSNPFGQMDAADFTGNILDFIGWPSADRDLPDGGTQMDGLSAPFTAPLQLLQAIAFSEHNGGGFYVLPNGKLRMDNRYTLLDSDDPEAIFGDLTSGEKPYSEINPVFDDADIWTTVRAECEKSPFPVVLTDETDELDYFRRTMSVGGLWSSVEMARAVAQRLLTRFSEPRLRFKAIQVPQSQNSFDQILERRINDRVTVRRRPPGGGTMEQDCWIEGVTHEVSPKRWRTTFALATADSVPNYFKLNDSTLGSSNVLGE